MFYTDIQIYKSFNRDILDDHSSSDGSPTEDHEKAPKANGAKKSYRQRTIHEDEKQYIKLAENFSLTKQLYYFFIHKNLVVSLIKYIFCCK